MGKGRHFLEYMKQQSNFDPGMLPVKPIVEITGTCRVLVENHLGVAAYGREKILVNVKYGSVCICGCNLEMIHMTKDQLVVYGRIDSVGLQRRG